jgi:hypothetical protein
MQLAVPRTQHIHLCHARHEGMGRLRRPAGLTAGISAAARAAVTTPLQSGCQHPSGEIRLIPAGRDVLHEAAHSLGPSRRTKRLPVVAER